jgi:hypothetical protein
VKASDVAFCAQVCREAAKVVCAETQLPYALYQDLSKAHALLTVALGEIKEEMPIEKEPA